MSTSVRERLAAVNNIIVAPQALPAADAAARELQPNCAPGTRITHDEHAGTDEETMFLSLTLRPGMREDEGRMFFQLPSGAPGILSASHPSYLVALAGILTTDWLDLPVSGFRKGRTLFPRQGWFRNLSDFLVGSLRTARGFQRAAYFRQLAALGFAHVTINGLAGPRPFESSPPGEQYFWFYDYSPDLDQFAESSLTRGLYPQEYLAANRKHLQENAQHAREFGLVPGLHINSPRSMPEEFWSRHPHLRGARVDHPRETFRPRYTLAMAHPVVQAHYRELVRSVLELVPELGFIHLWTNDSGAGFEFVSSLYAGRNGGPYLLREWHDDATIARVAAGNVLTYLQLLRDEGRAVNSAFRLVCDLGPFSSEREFMLPEFSKGIDTGDFASFPAPPPGARNQVLGADSWEHVKLDLIDNNILGLPFPWLVAERLLAVQESGSRGILAGATPWSLSPFDVNCEAIRFVRLHLGGDLEEYLQTCARRWGGARLAPQLLKAWQLSDAAVRAYPRDIPYSTFAFPWFRLWVRPFVPNIEAIPEAERKYYEEFLLATFNNPARVDLNNDMLWNFLTVKQAAVHKATVEQYVLPPLRDALTVCGAALQDTAADRQPRAVFADLRDRLIAGTCYFTTMKNMLAWTESVHGFLEAATPAAKESFHARARSMVLCEIENARTLLELWRTSETAFMPVSTQGETLHIYGKNFGELLERKITLMERHKDDSPWIDPQFMWRMKLSKGRMAAESQRHRGLWFLVL